VGWEARKIPAEGDVFFLDFPLYRTSRELDKLFALLPMPDTAAGILATHSAVF
jgi:hypothetical protein